MKIRLTTARVQAVGVVLRDIFLWVSGLLGIAYQQVTGRVSVELLLAYMSMIGIPGAVALVQLSRGRSETERTAEPSSGSHSSSSSSVSSPALEDGEM